MVRRPGGRDHGDHLRVCPHVVFYLARRTERDHGKLSPVGLAQGKAFLRTLALPLGINEQGQQENFLKVRFLELSEPQERSLVDFKGSLF